MDKLRIGIVGLGMAVTPHAKGLLDLADRVEVAHAFSPSEQRRAAFAERFPFPVCDRLETILDDRTVDAVLVLTPVAIGPATKKFSFFCIALRSRASMSIDSMPSVTKPSACCGARGGQRTDLVLDGRQSAELALVRPDADERTAALCDLLEAFGHHRDPCRRHEGPRRSRSSGGVGRRARR